jgi:hypothetical protein
MSEKEAKERKVAKESPTKWSKVFSVGLAGALIVGVIALAFSWPAKTAEPRSVPIAITGNNAQQVAMIKQQLKDNAGDKIDLVSVADRSEAVSEIETREAFGAIVLDMPSPEVLTASGNGAAANGVITSMAATLQAKLAEMSAKNPAAPKVTVKTTDVVPSHTATFDIAQLTMSLVFGGVIGGLLTAAAVRGRWQRLATLAVYAVVVGNVLYLVLHTWLDVLPAGYLAITGALTLGIFATASFVAGAYVVGGLIGLYTAILLTMLVANPISGLAIPPVFLPEPWGAIGQGLTIGAGGTLLRGAAYFPVAEVLTAPIIVLSVWSVAGIAGVVSRNRGTLGR